MSGTADAPAETGSPTAADAGARGPLGAAFGRLWAGSIAANLGDGLGRTAVPLLAATLTDDPLAFSVVGALAFVPWLVFGIPAGMIVDRVDRRVAIAVGNAVRVLALAALAGGLALGVRELWLVYLTVLLIGFGETVTDNATNALVPATVRPAQLDRANGRIQFAQIGVDNFLATPLAGVLYAIAVVIPLWSATAGYLLAIVLLLSLPRAVGQAHRLDARGDRAAATPLREAIGFIVRHRYLGPMAILVSVIGSLFSFGQATIVLLLLQEFAVPEALIGLVISFVGLGGLAGALLAPPLVERFGRGVVMLVSTGLTGVAFVLVGIAPSVWVGAPVFLLATFGVACWNVPWGAIRQELTPPRMLATVVGAFRTVSWGLFPIATVLGGLVARVDLRLPLWTAGLATLVVVALGARLLLSSTRVTAEHRARLADGA